MINKGTLGMFCKDWRILVNDGKGSLENRGGRAPVLLEYDVPGLWKISVEEFESLARSAAEPVNRLIGIPYCEQIPICACEAGKNFELREVGVLKFVG